MHFHTVCLFVQASHAVSYRIFISLLPIHRVSTELIHEIRYKDDVFSVERSIKLPKKNRN